MMSMHESDPFTIGKWGIMSDPAVGSVVTTLSVSLSGHGMTLAEASTLCQVIEAALGKREPWSDRVIACGLSHDKEAVLVVVFGAWIPVDFVPVMSRVQDMLLEGERDGFSSVLPPGSKVRKGSESRLCDLIRQARAKRDTAPSSDFFS